MRNDYIVKKLYIPFVIVSILSTLAATAGILTDNIVIGRFLGDDALGALGIIGPIPLIFSAFGSICSGGGSARAAQAMGKGKMDRVAEIFTATMIFALLTSSLLTVAGLVFTPQIARLRDNGKRFDPTEYLKNGSEQGEKEEAYGIRMIAGLAQKMEYRWMMNLNILIIELKKHR